MIWDTVPTVNRLIRFSRKSSGCSALCWMRSQTEVLPHQTFATETTESFEENLLKSHISLCAYYPVKSVIYARAWYRKYFFLTRRYFLLLGAESSLYILQTGEILIFGKAKRCAICEYFRAFSVFWKVKNLPFWSIAIRPITIRGSVYRKLLPGSEVQTPAERYRLRLIIIYLSYL